MAASYSSGFAAGDDGREACIQAIGQAKQNLDSPEGEIALAFVFASSEYSLQDILNGVTAELRGTTVVGLSSPGLLTDDGQKDSGVAVALVAGRGRHARAGWWKQEDGSPEEIAASVLKSLEVEPGSAGGLFLFAAGSADFHIRLAGAVAEGRPAALGGGLVGGPTHERDVFIFGNRNGGSRGVAAAALTGDLQIGAGTDHGWRPVGMYFQITSTDGSRILEINQGPPTAYYAGAFGQDPAGWLLPPLNELVRLYPFGLEQDDGPLLLRSPLRVELDGSIRMTTPVARGATGHLLIGSAAECAQAIQRAVMEAKAEMGSGPVRMALLIVDIAWKMLSEVQPLDIAEVVRRAVGAEIPIAGGFTLGQIAAGKQAGILNQHFQVILFGD